MNGLWFALRSILRQRARTALGVLGVAAIGALLFDMLMLSQGLVTSMRDLLDRTGWDVRVTASRDESTALPLIPRGADVLARIRGLPSVRSAIGVRRVPATIIMTGATPGAEILGVSGD